jgi:hypothetical protein
MPQMNLTCGKQKRPVGLINVQLLS